MECKVERTTELNMIIKLQETSKDRYCTIRQLIRFEMERKCSGITLDSDLIVNTNYARIIDIPPKPTFNLNFPLHTKNQ